MDGKVTKHSAALLAPAPNGWRVRMEGGGKEGGRREGMAAATFAEAVALLPPASPELSLRVALPTRLAVFERFTLPSNDPAEIAGMVRLQLEKTLPYPVEETTHHFQVLSERRGTVPLPSPAAGEPGGELPDATPADPLTEATVIACAVHNPSVDALCAPLLSQGRHPHRLTLWAMHVAAQMPAGAAVCAFWQEETEVVFAVFEDGKLSFAEIIASPDLVLNDFPQVMMSAELSGAPTGFSIVFLDPALAEFRESLADLTAAPVETLHLETAPVDAPVDLTPGEWSAHLKRREGRQKLKKRLAMAAMAYAALLLLMLAFVGVEGFRLRKLEKELVVAQPQVEAIIAEQARWRALAPAIDRRLSTVEVLYQVFESLPSADVRVTQFDHSPAQFMVEGEAPDAAQAIALGEKLKSREALADFRFESAPPTLLPNEHAQFRIFGKR